MPSAIGNFFIKSIIHSPLHRLVGNDFAVITLTGRKTGQAISTPINLVRLGDTQTVISLRSRTWWRNLKDGRPAQLRHAGRRSNVRAEIVDTPAEVTAGMAIYFSQYPGYAKYFKLSTDMDGKPDPTELEKLASERVLIRLFSIDN
jgi:deazaflavin-dependent oxidoreductase (nitroreductase family)